MFLSIGRNNSIRAGLVNLLAVLLFGLSSFAVALPVLDITTPDTALTIPVGSTADAVYTVTNNSGIVLPGLSIHAPALMQVNPAATTCGSSLGVGGVCEVDVTIGPSGLAGLLLLKPLGVCAFGGQLCAAATWDQRIQANFTSEPSFPKYHLYLPTQNNDLDIFDTETNAVVETIVNGGSRGVDFTSDGTRSYVGNTFDSVNVIDTSTNAVIDTILTTGDPTDLVVLPDGSHVYVATFAANTVDVINTATDTITDTISVGGFPFVITVTPDGSRVYVTNRSLNTVSVIDTATDTVIGTIAVGPSSLDIAATPDGLRVYVTNSDSDTVSVIDTATDSVIDTIVVGGFPQGVDITPDSSRVYVTNFDLDTVSVISTATDTVIDTIMITAIEPAGVFITPDGSRAYVTSQGDGGIISLIDTATDVVISTAPTIGGIPNDTGAFLSVASS